MKTKISSKAEVVSRKRCIELVEISSGISCQATGIFPYTFPSFAICLLLLALCLLPYEKVIAQGAAINTTGNAANSKAILDITSTSQGLLIPRMTTAQRDAINPDATATGLIIYNTDCNIINFYNGTTWIAMGNTGSVPTPGAITGNTTPSQNAIGITYSITTVSGATGYNWIIPTGATVASGQGTTSITVNFGTSSGDICVTAYNACGSSNASCSIITIISVPNSPVIGTAFDTPTSRPYNNGLATVNFTPSATGPAATSFSVTSSPGGFIGTGTSSPVTVAGLQSGVVYTFTVVAINASGASAASSASNSITATTVPQAPTIGVASVSYTSNNYPPATIASYTYSCSGGGTYNGTGTSAGSCGQYQSGGGYYSCVGVENAQLQADNTCMYGWTSHQHFIGIASPNGPTSWAQAQSFCTSLAPGTEIMFYGGGGTDAGSVDCGIRVPTYAATWIAPVYSNYPAATATPNYTCSGSGTYQGTGTAAGSCGTYSVPTTTVTFTNNATGGSAITENTATSSPGGLTGTGTSPITVSGLTTGTAYTFTVTATNANGSSTTSAVSNSVTP